MKKIDLIKYLNKESENQSVAKKVENWISESPENKEIAEKAFYFNQVAKANAVYEATDHQKAFTKFKKSIESRERKRGFAIILRNIERVAAILFIPILITLLYTYNTKGYLDSPMIEVASKTGVVTQLDLPDGSKVWLNSNSKIKYPQKFSRKLRDIELSGQAYFDVTPNKKVPFIVNTTSNYYVEVLGTEFDIMAYENDSIVETTLIEGSVKVGSSDVSSDIQPIILEPSERVIFDKKSNDFNIDLLKSIEESRWKDGFIIFKDTPMERALIILSRNYNVKFEVANTDIYNSNITATFNQESIHQILKYLKLAIDIEYEYNGDIIRIL